MIQDNLKKIQEVIFSVCKQIGRDPKEIVVVGASKYTDAEHVQEAVNAGLQHVGENRIQDAIEKFEDLDCRGVKVTRHMIGHLQSNKAKQAVEYFDLIQTVDSLKLASELNKHCSQLNKNIDILIQVNTSREDQKSGISPGSVSDFIKQVVVFDRLNILGLMTMAPFVDDDNIIRSCFKELKQVFENVKKDYDGENRVIMKYLSMGMSGDYEIALEEGANMVRIGRAIFL